MSAAALILLFVQGFQGTSGEAADRRPHLSLPTSTVCPDTHVWSEQIARCCPVCPWGTGALEPCAVPLDYDSDPDDKDDENFASEDSRPAATSSSSSPRDSTTTLRPDAVAAPPGCWPCVSGVTFSPNASHQEACRTCSTCPKNARMLTACNATHDVVCACEEGFFRSEETGQCVLCDLCPAGWGASTACGSSTNTVCRKCLNGTYSDVLNATASCRRCTVCGEGQRMLQTCTATQDTICLRKYMDIPPTYRYDIDGKEYQGLDRFYPGHGGEDDDGDNQPPAHHDDDDDGGIDVIPLYCAALGAVVVGLLAYVALVHYRRMRDKRMAREPHEDVEYSKASCADSGIYVESDHHHHHHHHQKKSVHAGELISMKRLKAIN